MGQKVLLVYYTRSGHTRDVAEAITRELQCEVEELRDQVHRKGKLGYLRSGFEGMFGRETRLLEPMKDPAAFDLVVVGGPVWNASLSSPVRSFLNMYRGQFPQIAFFLTNGGSGTSRVFRQMKRCAGRDPIATLSVRAAEIENTDYDPKLKAFIDDIHGRSPREPVPAFGPFVQGHST